MRASSALLAVLLWSSACAVHRTAGNGISASPQAPDGQVPGGTSPATTVSAAPTPNEDHKLRIWTVGDSITEGVNNGYRNRLWTVLKSRGFDVDFVGTLRHQYPDRRVCVDTDHDGHSGYTAARLRAELQTWYTAIPRPQIALLMAGSNDLAWSVPPGTPMESFVTEYMKLVDETLGLNPHLLVIVSTIAPQSSKLVEGAGLDRAELTAQYNDLVRRQVAIHPQYGKRLWLADVHRALGPGDLYDGIHPTREGADKIGDAWLQILLPLLTR